MTSEESLELISRMLRNAQERFVRGLGTPFILSGYLTAAMSLAVWYLLKTTGDERWNFLWFAIPVIILAWVLLQSAKTPKTTTFFDRAVGQVWIITGACCTLVSLYAFFYRPFPVMMVVSLLLFAGEAITGGILRLRYVQTIGIIGILLSFGIPFIGGINQILIFPVLLLLAMVIPGHIMNAQARKMVQRDGHV